LTDDAIALAIAASESMAERRFRNLRFRRFRRFELAPRFGAIWRKS
jgi:hypothetical protein